jgi:hypothetical protein
MNDDLESRLEDLLAERGKVSEDSLVHVLGSIDVLPPRTAQRARLPFAAMAAVILVAVVGLAIATSLRGPSEVATPTSPPPSIASPAVSPSTATATPSPSPKLGARPVWATQLASHLDCEGPPLTIGSDVPDILEPIDLATTPDGALANSLISYSNQPVAGYAPTIVDGNWALFRYLVDGRAKIHAVATNLFPDFPGVTGWEVVGLRTCDPSEYADAKFGPNAGTIWFDQSGAPVRTDRIYSHESGSHCFGAGTVLLSYYDPEYVQYVRYPGVEFEHALVVPFDADVRLPSDAVDTGLHTDDWHLFTIPSGRAVFVRTADGRIELWPRAKEPFGCM